MALKDNNNKMVPTEIHTGFQFCDGKKPQYSKEFIEEASKKFFVPENEGVQDIVKQFIAKKRKKTHEVTTKKKPKRTVDIESPTSDLGLTLSTNDDEDEDIEWSDCDELELSRNISILERSIHIDKKASDEKSEPSKSTTLPTEDEEEEDDVDWSDCDELELSRNISLFRAEYQLFKFEVQSERPIG